MAIIGRGDTGKTTILKAISAVLSPSWNLSFSDWDFTNCDTSEPIVIEAVVKDLPDELMTQSKYGLCLGLLNKEGVINYELDDLEGDAANYEKTLTIRLTVTNSLEPKWIVVSGANKENEKEITANDRAQLKMFQDSDYIDNHFSYSKGSPLYSLFRQNIDDKSTPEKKITEMVRKSYKVIQKESVFSEFDEVKDAILEQAKDWALRYQT